MSVSPSASWLVTLAVRVWPVVGRGRRDRDGVDDGAVLAAVTVQVNVSARGACRR